MKIFTQKSGLFILQLVLVFNLVGCRKSVEYERLIPTDAQMVTVINPKTIASKGNLAELDRFQFVQFIQNSLLEGSKEELKIWQEYKSAPAKIGLDLNRPIYIFTKEIHKKIYVGLSMKMNNKDDFEEFIEKIYEAKRKKKAKFKEKDGFTFLENFEKPLIGWNKNSVFVLASEYGNLPQHIDAAYHQIVKQDSSLYDNPSFGDMMSNSQDISVWYNDLFLAKLNPQAVKNTPKSSNYNYWITHISFVSDGISFTHKFHPNSTLKKELEKKPIWKKATQSDLFDFVPQTSYFNLYFDIYGERTYDLLNQQQFVDQLLTQVGIELDQYPNSFEGNMMMSVFDFRNQSFGTQLDTDANGSKISKLNEMSIPLFVLVAKMKDKAFIDQFVAQNSSKLSVKNTYWQWNTTKQFPLYLSQQDDYLFVTNSEKQMQKFTQKTTENPSFKQSIYAENAKYPLYFYANLDLDQYPVGAQQLLLRMLPQGSHEIWQPLFDQLHYLDLKQTDHYTKTGKIFFKDNKRNALENLLIGLDRSYTNLFLQNAN
ncbi:DUF4836 family protein [Vaginella massiliensis]|uniref:DUF4836 family protein n=1 Tax=Vaginella massiliensis TaxID=1816680 RepID=UPI003750F238